MLQNPRHRVKFKFGRENRKKNKPEVNVLNLSWWPTIGESTTRVNADVLHNLVSQIHISVYATTS